MKFSALFTVLALTVAALAHLNQGKEREIKYTSVEGFFLQDDAATHDGADFDYADWNFGLLNRTYPTDHAHERAGSDQWKRFSRYVSHLNSNCNGKTKYKVLVMGRHGEGPHNVAESYYGTPAWNCYWAEKDGNGTSVWADPVLTPAGLAEAHKANAYFKTRFESEGMPYFQSYYVSPLSRCVITADVSFRSLSLPRSHAFIPTVKEYFREGISIHTCDRRSSKTHIKTLTPRIKFEKGFAENDELWRGVEGETSEHQLARSKEVLDDVFTNDKAVWISVTSHSGEIGKLLATLNHRAFRLSTGQIIPVLVKAERVEPVPTPTYAAFTSEATCNSPPVTSISGQGCVCSDT
ncbi:Fc.00g032390.m01.CDS01 [Cosmosporella sp. VM-42]